MGKNLPEPSRNEAIEKLRRDMKVREEYYNENCIGRRDSGLDEMSDREILQKQIDDLDRESYPWGR